MATPSGWASGQKVTYSVQDLNGVWHVIAEATFSDDPPRIGFETSYNAPDLEGEASVSVAGATVAKRIKKLYASVNGKAKLVFEDPHA